MRKFMFSFLILVTSVIYLAPSVNAYYGTQPQIKQNPLTHTITCGIKNCQVSVNLKLPFDSFAPAEVLWRHKINNSTYSVPVKASTTHVFYVEKKSQIITVKADSYGMIFVKSFNVKL